MYYELTLHLLLPPEAIERSKDFFGSIRQVTGGLAFTRSNSDGGKPGEPRWQRAVAIGWEGDRAVHARVLQAVFAWLAEHDCLIEDVGPVRRF